MEKGFARRRRDAPDKGGPALGEPPMTLLVVAVAFFGLDLLAVVCALLWLNRHRALGDFTDARYRDHPERRRRMWPSNK